MVGCRPSSNYSPEEWALVNTVMDTVDSLRHQSATPVDATKVKALVLKTYQAHGEPVSEALVDQAISVAMDPFFPSPASNQKEEWWKRDRPDQYRQLPPAEQAKIAIGALLKNMVR